MNRDLSIQISHIRNAASTTKISTMPCDSIASANTMAVQLRYLPVSSPRANRPRPSIANDSAMENENSPAMVLVTLPP
jgi:hypothetical protein